MRLFRVASWCLIHLLTSEIYLSEQSYKYIVLERPMLPRWTLSYMLQDSSMLQCREFQEKEREYGGSGTPSTSFQGTHDAAHFGLYISCF